MANSDASRPIPAGGDEIGELRNCPACEGEVVTCGPLKHPGMVNGHQACCGSCGTSGPERPDQDSAIAAWNALPRRSDGVPSDIGARLLARTALDLSNALQVRAYLDADSTLHHEAATALEQLQRERDAALGYATRFLVSHVNEHCDPVPEWKPLPDLLGVLTQLDNATTIARTLRARISAIEAQAAASVEAVQAGYGAWAAKPHNAKWVRRLDGTPIPNDLVVCIQTAIRSNSSNGGQG